MDEKDLQNARQAYSMLCASLDDIGYHYQQNDEDLDVHFEVHGDGLPMELTISIDGERDLIRLLSFLPFKVKPERIQEIALGVCKINDILINGNFDLGIEKGRLTFRMVQSYRDSLAIHIGHCHLFLTEIITSEIFRSKLIPIGWL